MIIFLSLRRGANKVLIRRCQEDERDIDDTHRHILLASRTSVRIIHNNMLTYVT